MKLSYGFALFLRMTILGVIALGSLVFVIIQMTIMLSFEHLLDSSFLQFLQKSVELVARFELL